MRSLKNNSYLLGSWKKPATVPFPDVGCMDLWPILRSRPLLMWSRGSRKICAIERPLTAFRGSKPRWKFRNFTALLHSLLKPSCTDIPRPFCQMSFEVLFSLIFCFFLWFVLILKILRCWCRVYKGFQSQLWQNQFQGRFWVAGKLESLRQSNFSKGLMKLTILPDASQNAFPSFAASSLSAKIGLSK